MLVLSRKRGEVLIINDDIRITIVDNRRYGQVKIGIEAPPAVKVYREELHKRLNRPNNHKTKSDTSK